MDKKFNPGTLDRWVGIYQVTTQKGDVGQASEVVTHLKDVWAKRIEPGGSEDFDDKVVTLDNRQYVIHYDPSIADLFLETLFVQEGNRKYYVFATEELGRGRYLKLKASFRE